MQDISVEELKARLDAGEKLNFIDVREPYEYAERNLGALNIPLGNIVNAAAGELEDWKDQEVIIHCRSGARSGQACVILTSMGFANARNVIGGILAWQANYG